MNNEELGSTNELYDIGERVLERCRRYADQLEQEDSE